MTTAMNGMEALVNPQSLKFLFIDMCFKAIFHLFILGNPDGVDPAALPIHQPAKAWLWLVDVERTCALVIGRCLAGMLVWMPMSKEERESSGWLVSKLLSNGLNTNIKQLSEYSVNKTNLWENKVHLLFNKLK